MADHEYIEELVRSSWFSIFYDKICISEDKITILMRECVKNPNTPILAWNSEWSYTLRSHFSDADMHIKVLINDDGRMVTEIPLSSYRIPVNQYRFKMPDR